jgi:hypothetical protein
MESEQVLYQSKKKRKALRLAAADQAVDTRPEAGESNAVARELAKVRVESIGGVKFY